MSRRAKPAKAKSKAKRPVAGKPHKSDGSRIRDLEQRLAEAVEREAAALKREAEALDQQTATSEILGVISSSPTSLEPVFSAILERAMRFCNGHLGALGLYDGEHYRHVAHRGASPEFQKWLYGEPRPYDPRTGIGRMLHERRPIHIEDLAADALYLARNPHRVATVEIGGARTFLAVPMVKEGQVVGGIVVYRPEVRPFTRKQIELVQMFAEQAVIAIENVRLFNETKEALDRQTATGDILRVISSSPTDAQPVFEAIAESAVRLMGAVAASVYEFDGTLVHLRTLTPASWPHADELRRQYPRPPDTDLAAGRVILERTILHLADLQTDPATPSVTRQVAERLGLKSVLWVPMLRDGAPIGVIGVVRATAGHFSDKQVGLLETFADQAVIAIENVRLFTELQSRTSELARSVEELKALGEVSRAVSSTLDLESVLSTIVARAAELSAAKGGLIYEYDEAAQDFDIRGSYRLDEELLEVIRAAPIRLGEGVAGKAAVLRAPVQVSDVLDESRYDVARIRTVFERQGYRSVLAVPLLLEQRIIGVLVVWRQEPGSFAPEVVSLLQTFAAQSVLAVQNARLFRELADKSHQLEVASQHKSEFLANMSHELRTPLNAIIGFSEVLAERMFGELNERQEEYLRDIYASGQHLLSLINDILDLSKIEAGRMELELTDFHLPAAIDNALTLVRERAGRHGIALHHEIDAHLGQIRGDERKIKQVVLNLLSNALKFTPEGGRIDVRARLVDGMAEISIADTGVGIAPEDQETIFEEFRQVGTAAKQVEGTGLGLALSRKFIELHGGRIWVESQEGAGSRFTFTIPVRPAD